MVLRHLSSLFLLVLLSGCLEEIGNLDKDFSVELSPEIALPLIDSRLFIDDFSSELEDVSITADQDGTIVLELEKFLFEEVAETYFDIPNQTSPIINFSGLSSGGVALNGTFVESTSDVLAIEPDQGERIDVLRLKGGTMSLIVNSSYTVDTEVLFSINNLLIDGIPFQESLNVTPGNNSIDFDLTNSLFNLTLDGAQFNQLSYDVQLTLTRDGDVVLPSQSLEAYFQIQNPLFQLIIGESDLRVIDSQVGTESVNILRNLNFSNFRLEDPTFEVVVENSFGVPFEIDVQYLRFKDADGTNHDLTGDIISDLTQIDAPIDTQLGESITSTFEVNTSNSNLPDFLSNIPTEISYSASASYPGSGSKIFVLDTSKLSVTGKVHLPLYGSVMNMVLEKEFDFDGSLFDDAISGSLLFDIENSFPIEMGLLLEFEDSQGNTILTLLNDDPVLVPGAQVDSDGRSSESAFKEREIALSESDIEILRSAQNLRIYILLETSDNGTVPVRILNSDFIDLKIGVKAELVL